MSSYIWQNKTFDTITKDHVLSTMETENLDGFTYNYSLKKMLSVLNRTVYIYELSDLDDLPLYIGTTGNIKRRIKEHRLNKQFSHFHVIDRCMEHNRQLAEQYYINLYSDWGFSLKNKILDLSYPGKSKKAHGRLDTYFGFEIFLHPPNRKNSDQERERYKHMICKDLPFKQILFEVVKSVYGEKPRSYFNGLLAELNIDPQRYYQRHAILSQ